MVQCPYPIRVAAVKAGENMAMMRSGMVKAEVSSGDGNETEISFLEKEENSYKAVVKASAGFSQRKCSLPPIGNGYTSIFKRTRE